MERMYLTEGVGIRVDTSRGGVILKVSETGEITIFQVEDTPIIVSNAQGVNVAYLD